MTDPKLVFDLGLSWFLGTTGNVAYNLSTLGETNLHDTDTDVNEDNPDMVEDKDCKTHSHVQCLGGLPPIRVYSNGTPSHVDNQEFYE